MVAAACRTSPNLRNKKTKEKWQDIQAQNQKSPVNSANPSLAKTKFWPAETSLPASTEQTNVAKHQNMVFSSAKNRKQNTLTAFWNVNSATSLKKLQHLKVSPVKSCSSFWNHVWTTLFTVSESRPPVPLPVSWFSTNTSPSTAR